MPCERCAKLEAEIERLKYRVRDFELLLSSAPTLFEVPFTSSEARIADLLLRRSPAVLSTEMIYHDLYGGALQPPEAKTIQIFIHKIRRKLEPHKIHIDTIWGRGYRLLEGDATRLRSLIIQPKGIPHA